MSRLKQDYRIASSRATTILRPWTTPGGANLGPPERRKEEQLKKTPKKAPADVTPLLHDIITTQKLLGGVSRSTIYELFASGQLKSVKLGKRRFVPHEEALRYVASLGAAA